MELTLPITAQLEITEICNFRCQHCYRLDSDYKPDVAPDETVMAAARALAENKVFNIILTGGEPLTRPKLLESLLEYLADMDCNISINTNLTLLNEDFIEIFRKYQVRNLLVSCPSYDKDEYETITRTEKIHGFDKFKKNLALLSESGLHYTINMVVNQLNKGSVRKTAEFVKGLGATRFGATPMSLNPLYPRKDLLLSNEEVKDLLWTLKSIHDELGMEIDVMEALPKCAIPEEFVKEGLFFTKRKCQAGLSTAAISSNGDVRPCTHNPKSYGNMLETPLKEIWKTMSSWRDMTYIPTDCQDCALLSNCHGACRINALTMHGSLKDKDIWMTRRIEPEEVNKKTFVSELKPETKVRFMRVEWKVRKETDGFSLIFGRNGRQIAMVNDEVLALMENMGQKTMSVQEVAAMGDAEPDDKNLHRVLNHLI
jgi:radical SAM protein with 4Fe4S-binding SPASM domain